MLFQSPKGTSDILPEDQPYWRFLESRAEETSAAFGYSRIETPVFEDTRLFIRGIGEVTDIVEKETYTFEDRGGDVVTLRPEGTAPVCRAYLQHGMHNLPQPVRLYYMATNFRYERPQAGRYRQHHQFGIEVFGDSDAAIDAEVIEVGWRVLDSVSIVDKTLGLNSIGDSECRPGYIKELQAYYRNHLEIVCRDCQRRLEQNPLRLLDCKVGSCQPVIEKAPHSADHLCPACQEHWNALLDYVGDLGLPYGIDHRLVRGFDYYTRTVFEITPPGEGSQSTMLGGGRYDGLIQELGGAPTPGIGFGMGIERAILNVKQQGVELPAKEGPKVMVAHVGTAAKKVAAGMASRLRLAGIPAVLAPERGLRSQLRYATSLAASHAIIIGDDELERGVVVTRDLGKGEQHEVPMDELYTVFGTKRD